MFCEKCGMEIQSDWINCPRCGQRVNEQDVLQENIQENGIQENYEPDIIEENNERRYSFADWIRFRLTLAGVGIIIFIILILLAVVFC